MPQIQPSSKNCLHILNYYWKYLRQRFSSDSLISLSLDSIFPQCSSSPFLGVPRGLCPFRSQMEGCNSSQFYSLPISSLLSYYFSSSTDSSPARLILVLLFLQAATLASSLNTSTSHSSLGQVKHTNLYLPLGHMANQSSKHSSPDYRGSVSRSSSSTAKMYLRLRVRLEEPGDASSGILSSTAGVLEGGCVTRSWRSGGLRMPFLRVTSRGGFILNITIYWHNIWAVLFIFKLVAIA